MIHLPFADRMEAGALLGLELSRRIEGPAVVLALARGGVPVGFAIAEELDFPLDVIVVRKLGVPWQEELAMGAIAGMARVLNEPMVAELGITGEEVEKTIVREQAELQRREALYRGTLAALPVRGQTVILVDDGLATGSSMQAAIQHVKLMGAARVIVAVPVGSAEACGNLRQSVDDVICLATPEYFYAVGEWYKDFRQVSDKEVSDLLANSRSRLPGGLPAAS